MPRFVDPKQAVRHPARQQIVDLVAAFPGIHMTGIAQHVGCETSSVLWHVAKLTSAGLIRSERIGGLRVFYSTAGGLTHRHRSIEVVLLRSRTARRIHDFVDRRPGSTVKELVEDLGLNPATARWHIRKLVQAGVLCNGRPAGQAMRVFPGIQTGTPCQTKPGAIVA